MVLPGHLIDDDSIEDEISLGEYLVHGCDKVAIP